VNLESSLSSLKRFQTPKLTRKPRESRATIMMMHPAPGFRAESGSFSLAGGEDGESRGGLGSLSDTEVA
jgi:hypothetical protein